MTERQGPRSSWWPTTSAPASVLPPWTSTRWSGTPQPRIPSHPKRSSDHQASGVPPGTPLLRVRSSRGRHVATPSGLNGRLGGEGLGPLRPGSFLAWSTGLRSSLSLGATMTPAESPATGRPHPGEPSRWTKERAMTTAQQTMYTLRQLRDPLDQAGRRSTCPTDVDPREHTAEAIAQTLGVSRKTHYRSLAVRTVAGPRARPPSLAGERTARWA